MPQAERSAATGRDGFTWSQTRSERVSHMGLAAVIVGVLAESRWRVQCGLGGRDGPAS